MGERYLLPSGSQDRCQRADGSTTPTSCPSRPRQSSPPTRSSGPEHAFDDEGIGGRSLFRAGPKGDPENGGLLDGIEPEQLFGEPIGHGARRGGRQVVCGSGEELGRTMAVYGTVAPVTTGRWRNCMIPRASRSNQTGLCGAFCHHVRGPSRPSPVSSMTRISAGGPCSGGQNGAPTMKPRHLLRTILPALTIGTATRPEGR